MRLIKHYKKRKGSKKQQLELNYYNSFADKTATHIFINNSLSHKSKK